MGLLSNRVERSEIKAGDHIYTWRAVYTYSHHGIYVGGEKVVHFTRKKETPSAPTSPSLTISSSSSTPTTPCPSFPDCGFQIQNSHVILSCLTCFLDSGSLYRFEYGVPPSLFLSKLRGGTCTIAPSDPPDQVIHRAMYLLRNGFGRYDLFENNCEDFAIYCKTGLLCKDEQGIGRSGQASSVVGLPLAAMVSSSLKILAAGPVGMGVVGAGMYCAGRYVTDVGVRQDVVKVPVEDLGSGFVSLLDDVGTVELESSQGNGIDRLVMGAAADKQFSRKMKMPKSQTTITVRQQANSSCKN